MMILGMIGHGNKRRRGSNLVCIIRSSLRLSVYPDLAAE
jgi:hypothetical protein